MQNVLAKLPAVAFLLGEQQIKEKALYRRASFCVLCEVDGVKIAYNTLTKELAELTDAEAGMLCADSVSAGENSIPLIRSYFLVPIDNDDKKLCDGVCAFARSLQKVGGYTDYTVFTTTDCNARCFYCYEQSCAHVHMSADTAKDAARFIAENSGGKKVSLTWYGGEPLMNTKAMDIICEHLLHENIAFTSLLATNGSLLDGALISHAKEKWHLEKTQVTLDGTPKVYEKIKAYTDKANTFEKVISNIEKLLDASVKVNIRLNIDTHNIGDMHALCKILAERFAGRKGINAYTALLFDCEGAKRPISNVDRYELAKKAIEIEDMLSEKGILKPRKLKNSLSTCFCKADSPNSLVILADGRAVKCDFYTDTHIIGDIKSGIDKDREKDELAAFSKRLDCKGCTAYPNCLRSCGCPTGGCDSARQYVTEQRLLRSVKYAYRIAKEKK